MIAATLKYADIESEIFTLENAQIKKKTKRNEGAKTTATGVINTLLTRGIYSAYQPQNSS